MHFASKQRFTYHRVCSSVGARHRDAGRHQAPQRFSMCLAPRIPGLRCLRGMSRGVGGVRLSAVHYIVVVAGYRERY